MTVGEGIPNGAAGITWNGSVQHENGFNISFSGGDDETADGDEAIQDLIDHLATWPHLKENTEVGAGRAIQFNYPITVTEE